MPLGEFTVTVFEMANEQSVEYKDGKRVIKDAPIIATAQWKKAVLWAKNIGIPAIKKFSTAAAYGYYVPSTKYLELKEKTEFDLQFMEQLQDMQWKIFDQYENNGYGMFYNVRVDKDKQKWTVNSECECVDFYKRSICKHIIGIALREKIAILPKIAITTVLTQNKKSGLQGKKGTSSTIHFVCLFVWV